MEWQIRSIIIKEKRKEIGKIPSQKRNKIILRKDRRARSEIRSLSLENARKKKNNKKKKIRSIKKNGQA